MSNPEPTQPQSIEEVQWTELQATAHVLDWELNERRQGNLQDPETRALVNAGLLVIVDEETRNLLPPPTTVNKRGCGCGQ